MAVSVGIWLMSQGALMDSLGLGQWHLQLPAEPWSERPWYFNPFGWQLVFFTGFALIRGWIPVPPVNPMLIGLAIAIVVASMVLNYIGRELGWDWTSDWRAANRPLISKTDQGAIRFVQFMAMAYLGWVLAGPGGAWLQSRGSGALARLWGGRSPS